MLQRGVLEADAFKWIENELIQRFINNLAASADHQEHLEEQSADELSNIEENLNIEETKEADNSGLSILGAQGLKLLMDLGSHVDPDFVEALIRECLEEKINLELRGTRKSMEMSQEVAPVASPRKRSLDRGNLQSFSFDQDRHLVAPVTPVISPQVEVLPGNCVATIGTQVSFEKEQLTVLPTPVVQRPQQPVVVSEPIQPQIVEFCREESESLLEETMTEDGVCCKFKLIYCDTFY